MILFQETECSLPAYILGLDVAQFDVCPTSELAEAWAGPLIDVGQDVWQLIIGCEGCFSVRVDPGAFPGLGSGRGYLVQGVRRRRVITVCDLEVLDPLGQGTAGTGAGRQLFPRRPVFRHVSRVGGVGDKSTCCPGSRIA